MVCVDFFYNYWGFLDKYIQDVDNPFQMVTHNGQNLTLTPGIAQQVAGLPALLPVRHHAANPHVNAQARPSRNQGFFFYFFIQILIIYRLIFLQIHMSMPKLDHHKIRYYYYYFDPNSYYLFGYLG